MKILVMGQMKDLQTGLYIIESIEKLGYEAGFVDTRNIIEEHGLHGGQQIIIEKLKELDFDADIVIVLKGLEMSLDTLKKVKELLPNAKFLNWFFDVYMADKKIWENESYFETLRFYDYFICSLKGVADRLKENGFNNVVHIAEACFPELNGEQDINNFQKKKFGEDVAFIGSVGSGIHKDRTALLSRIAKDGFHLKIWGGVIGEMKSIPPIIRPCMQNIQAINEKHSQICQSSLVNIGIDQDPNLDESWSARLYRVMCAGGLYLSTPTRGLDKHFKINKDGEDITEDQDLVVFYSENDLIDKLDFLLEHDDIRAKIAKNGKKTVMDKHKFVDRIKDIIELIKR